MNWDTWWEIFMYGLQFLGLMLGWIAVGIIAAFLIWCVVVGTHILVFETLHRKRMNRLEENQ